MNAASSNSYDWSGQHFDGAVVGGGQAGLAIGYFLRQHGCRFVILERASESAPAWRERWDSLTLFTAGRDESRPVDGSLPEAAEAESSVGRIVDVRVGDPDPRVAIEDAPREFPADEVVLVTRPQDKAGWLEQLLADGELGRRLGVPVRHLVDNGSDAGPGARAWTSRGAPFSSASGSWRSACLPWP